MTIPIDDSPLVVGFNAAILRHNSSSYVDEDVMDSSTCLPEVGLQCEVRNMVNKEGKFKK